MRSSLCSPSTKIACHSLEDQENLSNVQSRKTLQYISTRLVREEHGVGHKCPTTPHGDSKLIRQSKANRYLSTCHTQPFSLMASGLSISAGKTTDSSQASLAESRKDTRRTRRRRRELQDSAATPTTSVPSTPKNRQIDADYKSKEATTLSNIVTNGSTTFEEGEDFVPFVISDPSDDEPGPSRRTDRTNERQRETRKKYDRNDMTDRQLSERQVMSNSDLANEVPTSDHVKGKSKMPRSEREWDQGKEDATLADDVGYDKRNGRWRDRKRKYDEYDDGYSDRKRRVEVGSRKCPWVNHLNSNSCSNVAEM